MHLSKLLLSILCLSLTGCTTLMARECMYLNAMKVKPASECLQDSNLIPMPDFVAEWWCAHSFDPLSQMFYGWHY